MTRPYDALVVSEARTKAIVDSALDCVVTIDAGGRIVEWNPAAERIFGRLCADVVGHEMAEIIINTAAFIPERAVEFTEIQDAIKSIDEAIEDEARLAGTVSRDEDRV